MFKSKGGLTRHTRSKHPAEDKPDKTRVALTKEVVASIVESIKAKLKEENLYGTEIMNSMATVSCTDALWPFYTTFCRKNNQDNFLECVYGLITRSFELLNCENCRFLNIWPDFTTIAQQRRSPQSCSKTSTPKQLDPAERGPLSYAAGYVISKLFHFNKKKEIWKPETAYISRRL